MTSEELYLNPLVTKLTLLVLKTMKYQKIIHENKQVINADLIPRFSRRTYANQKSHSEFPEEMIPSLNTENIQFIQELKKPEKIIVHQIPIKPGQIKQIQNFHQMPPMRHQIPQIAPPPLPLTTPKEDYGKLNQLLNDQTISSIECSGPGKNIIVIRAGQKQFTKIIFTPGDIKEFLLKTAEIAHVPLLEGVFRAAVENFHVDAIYSENINSRFVIKKATPYSLIDSGFR